MKRSRWIRGRAMGKRVRVGFGEARKITRSGANEEEEGLAVGDREEEGRTEEAKKAGDEWDRQRKERNQGKANQLRRRGRVLQRGIGFQ